MTTMQALVAGALTMGYAVTALFFFKFWRQSHDRLFAMFSAAFGILSIQRPILAMISDAQGDTTWLYALRLAAYLLILAAIVDKNRAPSKR
jgi:hypothetical protein